MSNVNLEAHEQYLTLYFCRNLTYDSWQPTGRPSITRKESFPCWSQQIGQMDSWLPCYGKIFRMAYAGIGHSVSQNQTVSVWPYQRLQRHNAPGETVFASLGPDQRQRTRKRAYARKLSDER